MNGIPFLMKFANFRIKMLGRNLHHFLFFTTKIIEALNALRTFSTHKFLV